MGALNVGLVLFSDLTQLDLTGPYEVFARMPKATVHLIAATLAPVRSEKGLTITRFKGLGEMNAEELRETTLDPNNRTLIRISMEDLGAADELFRVLMGDTVEPRRDFIQKHALDVKNLDV